MCFDPGAMMKRIQIKPVVLGAIVGLALAGCALFGDDSGISYKALPVSDTRLIFAEPALREATAQFQVAQRTASGNRIERGRWNGLFGEQAELMLIETLTSRGVNAPADPRDLIGDFRGLVQLKASFGDLYQSDTGAGPAIWRRFSSGDRSCVIFSQRWDSGPGTPVVRILSGYYCAKPGGTYTIQDAQATLRTISLKPRQNKPTS